jgi:hypothetical protein
MFRSYIENNLTPLSLSAYILIIVMVINITKKIYMVYVKTMSAHSSHLGYSFNIGPYGEKMF